MVGCFEGFGVEVGFFVGFAVVESVGFFVGFAVGESVGFFVGFAVGESVGFFVGFAVGVEVVEMQLKVVLLLLLLHTSFLIQLNLLDTRANTSGS
jgi:hypothetical protein